LVTPADAKAHQLMQKWWASHGRRADDATFLAWLERNFPAPPAAGDRRKELRILEAQKRRQTAAGVKAAMWLEVHGKKDIWKLYAHDQAEWMSADAGDVRKADVKALLKLSKKASHRLSADFGASAPYVLEPALAHKSHHIVNGCPCSYPSNHASKAAAVRTYLGGYQPHMVPQYRWMEDEIDWSRIYMAGHVPSDISGGALLGDMVGEYFLVTRGRFDPAVVNHA
jgi:membrane-associated phospholipid phosphatase